jgi:HSP20 family molecular chaperone IbpA
MKMKLTRNSIVSAPGVALLAPLFLAAASPTRSGTSVPTPASSSSNPKASAPPSASPSSGFEGLDQSIITRMARMQGRMEQIFRDAFPNDLTTGLHTLQLNSAVHLDDQKDRYVVHFYLPDRDLENVDLHLKNGELRLTASETEKSQQQGVSKMESGQYEQLITLPGPVQEKGMKVTRKNGTIVVTLPKG